ncbi:Retrotransposon-like protein [Gossypium australe]|uniref:Retrotransposon-like protein n=1 Tax=Gossypium australe TaxID=47621 RepID=A0A5B6WI28_9ROSI|nr:Retrotransposon-like protein [Gossypium australe]
MDSSESRRDISQVLVIKEFFGVFPRELPSMSPDKEVEFFIELELGTAPISYALYKMAPLELNELKTQLQDLLDNGFIRPSKKDGTLCLCIDYCQLNKVIVKNHYLELKICLIN